LRSVFLEGAAKAVEVAGRQDGRRASKA
jgi:hypothetical protein